MDEWVAFWDSNDEGEVEETASSSGQQRYLLQTPRTKADERTYNADSTKDDISPKDIYTTKDAGVDTKDNSTKATNTQEIPTGRRLTPRWMDDEQNKSVDSNDAEMLDDSSFPDPRTASAVVGSPFGSVPVVHDTMD